MIDTGLKDKIVLITGANHGIGAETAKAFAKEGAKVFITYLRIYDAIGEQKYREQLTMSADKILEDIHQFGGKAEALEIDLAVPTNIPKLYNQVEKTLGQIEILVNNAAYCKSDTFIPNSSNTVNAPSGYESKTITEESHDKHFAINSRATALLIAEFAKRHIERKANRGRIISVSTDGDDCFPTEISYGASKAALVSYTRSAAVELGKYGITSNIISLGAVQTGWMTKEVEKHELETMPLKHIGQPEDVADVIIFLASQQARWITGQKIYVGGGHRMM